MVILLKKSFCLLLLMFLAAWLVAQPYKPSLLKSISVDLSANHGFFMAEKSKTQYLRDSHTNFFELAFSAQTSGQKDWHIVNNFPKIGIGLMFGNTGSDKYLGKMAAIYPFVNFPLYRAKHFYTHSNIK